MYNIFLGVYPNDPGTMNVAKELEDKYDNGTKLSLFFYDAVEKKLVDQEQIVTVTNGVVTFNLTHCSSYVLAEISSNVVIDDTVADNNTMLYVGIAIVIVVLIISIGVVLFRPKKKA